MAGQKPKMVHVFLRRWDLYLVNTIPADNQAPSASYPVRQDFLKVSSTINDSEQVFIDQAISFDMADEILWYLTALWELYC